MLRLRREEAHSGANQLRQIFRAKPPFKDEASPDGRRRKRRAVAHPPPLVSARRLRHQWHQPPTQIASDLADFPLSDPGHRALASAKTPTTIRLVPTSNTRSFATTYR